LNGDGKISKDEFEKAARETIKNEEAADDTTTTDPVKGDENTAPNTDNEDDSTVNPVGDNTTPPVFTEPNE